jgi:hypothetical protein
MHHFKRVLWLAAWGVWVWLGFGLHRELPRKRGPPVQQLSLTKEQAVVGFLADSGQVAVSTNDDEAAYQTYEALTGRKIRDIPRRPGWRFYPDGRHRTHGVVIVHGDSTGSNKVLHLVDLRTGEVRKLSDKFGAYLAVHPTKPWIAFAESAPAHVKHRPLVVIDWTTGAELLIRERHPERTNVYSPVFLERPDRLVVATVPPQGALSIDQHANLEVWRLDAPFRLEKIVRVSALGRLLPTNSSKIGVQAIARNQTTIGVFDLESASPVFFKAWTTTELDRPFASLAQMSRSGRSVLVGKPATLWNVEDDSVRWAGHEEMIVSPPQFDDAFKVPEAWRPTWLPSRWADWNTVAVRELDDGRVRFRCWREDAAVFQHLNIDGTLAMTQAGTIYQMPFGINWLLLALCQTILALPLVLLWAALKWRSRRAARRQPAESNDR